MLLHAAELEGPAVEGVVEVEHPGLPVFGVGVALQLAVALEVEPVGGFLLGSQTAPDAVQDLFFQREAGELLHLHQLEVDGGHMGAALGFDRDHVRDVEHDERFPHGGAADAQLLGQLTVVQLVAGFELHCNDPAPDGLVSHFACTPYCHGVSLPSVIYQFVFSIIPGRKRFVKRNARKSCTVFTLLFWASGTVPVPTRPPAPDRRPHPRRNAVL